VLGRIYGQLIYRASSWDSRTFLLLFLERGHDLRLLLVSQNQVGGFPLLSSLDARRGSGFPLHIGLGDM
jgi:hypothetical protein